MKVKHIFGGNVYVISNFGVARNPIFRDKEDVDFFKKNVNKYLSEICDIYAYSHEVNQFQYLIKIKERDGLADFFFNKQNRKEKNMSQNLFETKATEVPDSYLIFSQEVSNMLNSYAKKFNKKHKRKGGLFGDRYSKILVKSEEEMEVWIDKLNKMESLIFFHEPWKIRNEEELFKNNENGEWSSDYYYREGNGERKSILSNFSIYKYLNLRGCFQSLPPISIKSSNFSLLFNQFQKIHGHPPLW